MHLDDTCIDDYNNLDNIDKAVWCLMNHFERGDGIGILVDPDV